MLTKLNEVERDRCWEPIVWPGFKVVQLYHQKLEPRIRADLLYVRERWHK